MQIKIYTSVLSVMGSYIKQIEVMKFLLKGNKIV